MWWVVRWYYSVNRWIWFWLYIWFWYITNIGLSFIICCIIIIFFNWPLLSLNKMKRMNGNKSGSNKKAMREFPLVLKWTILTVATIVSTVFTMVLIIFSSIVALIAIDYAMNCLCIMLFNGAYGKLYRFVCCGCIKICSKILRFTSLQSTLTTAQKIETISRNHLI